MKKVSIFKHCKLLNDSISLKNSLTNLLNLVVAQGQKPGGGNQVRIKLTNNDLLIWLANYTTRCFKVYQVSLSLSYLSIYLSIYIYIYIYIYICMYNESLGS